MSSLKGMAYACASIVAVDDLAAVYDQPIEVEMFPTAVFTEQTRTDRVATRSYGRSPALALRYRLGCGSWDTPCPLWLPSRSWRCRLGS
ncbi:MAG: hypothetical protein WCP28_11785 [Actinomycetes bacterium]